MNQDNYPVPLYAILNKHNVRYRAKRLVDWRTLALSNDETYYIKSNISYVKKLISSKLEDIVDVTWNNNDSDGRVYYGEICAMNYELLKQMLYEAYREGITASREIGFSGFVNEAQN